MNSKYEGHTSKPWAVSYYGDEDSAWPDAIYNPETNQVIAKFDVDRGYATKEVDAWLMADSLALATRVEALEAALRAIAGLPKFIPPMAPERIVNDMQQVAKQALEAANE